VEYIFRQGLALSPTAGYLPSLLKTAREEEGKTGTPSKDNQSSVLKIINPGIVIEIVSRHFLCSHKKPGAVGGHLK